MAVKLNRQAFWDILKTHAIYSLKIFDESEKLKYAIDEGFEDLQKLLYIS